MLKTTAVEVLSPMNRYKVLVSISVPTTGVDEYFAAYKQSRRREDDIAIVNAAFRVTFHPQSSRIAQLKMAFGGMAPTTVTQFHSMLY